MNYVYQLVLIDNINYVEELCERFMLSFRCRQYGFVLLTIFVRTFLKMMGETFLWVCFKLFIISGAIFRFLFEEKKFIGTHLLCSRTLRECVLLNFYCHYCIYNIFYKKSITAHFSNCWQVLLNLLCSLAEVGWIALGLLYTPAQRSGKVEKRDHRFRWDPMVVAMELCRLRGRFQ